MRKNSAKQVMCVKSSSDSIMHLREEQYILTPAQDVLGRKTLVTHIVNAIKAKVQKTHGPLILGIYGSWGEGKTATMRMVKHDLELNSVSCLWFNPWTFSGERRMVTEFLGTLASVSFPNSGFAEILTLYTEAYLRNDVIETNPVLADYKASLAKGFQFDINDLDCIKKEISTQLEKIDKHLVVFIDDVDRLDAEEVQTIFKMIRQVVDFKNIIYVMGMDPDVVSRQLGLQYGEGQESRGRSYLEKIVNIPIVLPAVQDERLVDLIRKEVVEVWRDSKIEVIESDIDKVVAALLPIMNTKRAIDRFSNQLSFIVPTIGLETEFVDLCLMESLKYLNEKGWLEVYNQRKGLLKEGVWSPNASMKNAEEKRVFDDAVSKVVAHYPDNLKLFVKGLLEEHLFTQIHPYNTNNLSKCINDSKYFKQYFIAGIPDDTIPRTGALEFAELLQIGDNTKAIAWINSKLQTYSSAEVDRSACLALDILENENMSGVAAKLIEVLSLSNLSDNFGFATINNPSFTDATIYAYIIPRYMLIRTNDGKRVLDKDKEIEVLTKVFKEAPLNFCMTLFTGIYDQNNIRPDKASGLLDIIKKRLADNGKGSIFSYSYPIKTRFFIEWKETNPTEYSDFWIETLNERDFDLGLIIKDWLTAVSPQSQLQEIITLTELLSPVAKEMKANLLRSEFKTDKLVRLFVWNCGLFEKSFGDEPIYNNTKELMKNVEISESVIAGENGKKVKIAILRTTVQSTNIQTINDMMDLAVSEYVLAKGHNTFTEVHRDTPNIRIIISDLNNIEFKPYNGEHL